MANSTIQPHLNGNLDGNNMTTTEDLAFTHYCVVDFEATCMESRVIRPQEIIEFPAVMLSAASLEVVTEFHSYVRPLFHPTLTEFCTNLTGITQNTVDCAPEFSKVYHSFLVFLKEFTQSYRLEHEGQEPNILFVSHGDWDFRTMLPSQCKTSGLKVPTPLTRWMNVKVLYSNSTAGKGKRKGMGMERMLADLGLKLVGRHHSGIDDSRNIARILVELIANRGAVPLVTGNICRTNETKESIDNRSRASGGGDRRGSSDTSRKSNKFSVLSI
jgi:inhibitor of KinA sporulation pathway (predicted exonuclease)